MNPNWKDWGISRRECNRGLSPERAFRGGRAPRWTAKGKAHCVAKVMNDIKVSMKLVAQWCALPLPPPGRKLLSCFPGPILIAPLYSEKRR